jgi:hypothetical protein
MLKTLLMPDQIPLGLSISILSSGLDDLNLTNELRQPGTTE